MRIIIENADAVMKSTIGKCQHALTGFRPLAPQDGGEVSPPLTRSATKAKPMRLWPIACIMPHATPRDRATRCSAMYQSSCKAGQLHSWCKAGYDANLDEFREMEESCGDYARDACPQCHFYKPFTRRIIASAN